MHQIKRKLQRKQKKGVARKKIREYSHAFFWGGLMENKGKRRGKSTGIAKLEKRDPRGGFRVTNFSCCQKKRGTTTVNSKTERRKLHRKSTYIRKKPKRRKGKRWGRTLGVRGRNRMCKGKKKGRRYLAKKKTGRIHNSKQGIVQGTG